MDLDGLQSCLCAGRAATLHTAGFPTLHTSPVPGDPGASGFGSKGSARASSQPAPCSSCCTGAHFSSGLLCTKFTDYKQGLTNSALSSLVLAFWVLVEKQRAYLSRGCLSDLLLSAWLCDLIIRSGSKLCPHCPTTTLELEHWCRVQRCM